MAITSFTIGGVEVYPLYPSFDVRETVGGTSTLACDVVSEGSPVLRFGVFDEVVVQEDGVTIFAGTVTQTLERGYGGPNLYDADGAPQIVTTITAEDFNRLAERVVMSSNWPAGRTVKQFLVSMISNFLDQVDVTLDPSQVDGPTLPAFTWDLVRVNEAIQAVSDATGYLWRIDYDRQIRMWLPGDLAAPFAINEFDDPPRWTGDVEVETRLGDEYANRVTVIAASVDELQHIFTITGDGATSTYTLDFQLVESYGIIHRYESDGVTPSGGETFGIPPDAPLQWSYDASNNTITREIGPTESGFVYKLTYHGTFEGEATAEDAGEIAAHGLYEHVERRSDITTAAAAQELADALLAQFLNSGEQVVTYQTRYPSNTLRAGQQQAISATARDVSGNFIIRDMEIRAEIPPNVTGGWLTRRVTAKLTQPMLGKWQHTYRDWLERGRGGSSPVATTGVPSGAAPPLKSVQFNRLGAFGGDDSFTYDEATSTPMVGLEHTPGGADNLLVGQGHTVS